MNSQKGLIITASSIATIIATVTPTALPTITPAVSLAPIPTLIRDITGIDVVTKVNTFYTDAFNRLTLWGFVLLGVIGFLWPLILDRLEKRSFKIREDELKQNLLKELRQELEDKFNVERDEFKKQLDEALSEVKKLVACSRGSAFFIQGRISLESKNYLSAFESFVIAANSLVFGKDMVNAQRALDALTTSCLLNLKKDDFEFNEYLNRLFADLIRTLEDNNKDSFLTSYIRKLKAEYSKAIIREKTDNPKEENS